MVKNVIAEQFQSPSDQLVKALLSKNIYNGTKTQAVIDKFKVIIQKAFEELKKYISRKTAQQNDQNRLLKLGGITQRQAEILYMMLKDENAVITVKDVSTTLLVTPTTAKHDILGLIDKGLLSEISLNQQKKGYIRGLKYKENVESLYS